MYAMRDIEPGEELSYDYNYGLHEPHDGHNLHAAGKLQARNLENDQENTSKHIICHCGAKNCRKWLWRPSHTVDDSEDD